MKLMGLPEPVSMILKYNGILQFVRTLEKGLRYSRVSAKVQEWSSMSSRQYV